MYIIITHEIVINTLTEIKTLDLSQYMYGTIFVTMLILMSLFPHLKNLSNVSYCLRNLAMNYNAFV